MSNRNDNDFDFDSDDFFGGEDDGGFGSDEDFPAGLGDADESDMPNIEPERERGTSPAFILLAILMILLFVGGLGVVLYLATVEQPPSPAELTSTAIVEINMTIMAQLGQTQTQNAINQAQTLTAQVQSINLTQTALAASPTASSTNQRPPTLTPTPSANPDELTSTALIANLLTREVLSLTPPNLTETAAALTLTALAYTPTSTPTGDPTQTALALTLAALNVTPTVIVPTASPSPTIIATSPLEAVQQTATYITGLYLTQTALAGGGVQGAGVGDPFLTQTAVMANPNFFLTQTALPANPYSFLTLAANPNFYLTQTAVAPAAAQGGGDGAVAANSNANPISSRNQQLVDLTQTAAAIDPNFYLTQTAVSANPFPQVVADGFLTQTAVAANPLIYLTQTALAGGIPTPQVGLPTAIPTALPDTGLFDDVMGGDPAAFGGMAMMLFGLVGFIVVVRKARESNRSALDKPMEKPLQTPPPSP